MHRTLRASGLSSPVFYALRNKNSGERAGSTSGGVFPVLAASFLKQGGVVFGAQYTRNMQVSHTEATKYADILPMRGSKYIQSTIGNTFASVKKHLENSRPVLFTGTPCQLAGLRAFLGGAHPLLTTIDVVCHGVMPRIVAQRYLEALAMHHGFTLQEDTHINFRDKTRSWRNYSFTVRNSSTALFSEPARTNVLFQGYVQNLFLRPACYACRYNTHPRQADISLADFWGSWDYPGCGKEDRGTSLVLINSPAGEHVLHSHKKQFSLYREVNPEFAMTYNPVLVCPPPMHHQREAFFTALSSGTQISTALHTCLQDTATATTTATTNTDETGILNLHFSDYNYGAVLVPWAMQQLLGKKGIRARTIDYSVLPRGEPLQLWTAREFYSFRNQHLRMTHSMNTPQMLDSISQQFSTVITGSDQVWRYWNTEEQIYTYFLGWVPPEKKLIAYAPSFAVPQWEGTTEAARLASNLVKRFDAVSVRELDGVNIIRDVLNAESIQVLDPTLLLDSGDYASLYDSFTAPKDHYLALYFLGDEENRIRYNPVITAVASTLGLMPIDIKCKPGIFAGKPCSEYNPVGEWLVLLASSNCLVTDSYHGVLFALIHRKNFVYIERTIGGNSRLDTILQLTGLQERFINSLNEEVIVQLLKQPIDYNAVYQRLFPHQKRSLDFLYNSMTATPDNNIQLKKMQGEMSLFKYRFSQTQKEIQRLQTLLDRSITQKIRRWRKHIRDKNVFRMIKKRLRRR